MIVPRPDILLTLGWRRMRGMLRLPLWEGSMEKTEKENSDKRVVLWVGSYSPKTCHARPNQGAKLGRGPSLQDSWGCLGWVLRTQLSLSALQVQNKGSFWWGVMRGEVSM